MSLKHQRGAGLIEALVAILILSIGLLGMIGMQTAALKYEQTGWARSALAANISSLAERIRANSNAQANAYVFARTYQAERTSIESDNTYLTPGKDCESLTCTEAELATYDLTIWRRDLNQQLPGAVGMVSATGTKGVDLRFLITVAWFDKDNLNGIDLPPPNLCTATTTGIDARNCCPAALGTAQNLAGVRCANVEMIP
jgi:type IV pilus assembly protein PilV